MNSEQKYNQALRKALDLYNQGLINPPLEHIFPELKEKSYGERIRKELIEHIKANQGSDYVLFKKFSPDDVIAWLETQKNTTDKEYVFRPLAGDTIEKAVERAVKLDGKVVLAFNGAYIPVANKTKDEIVAEYNDWIKKQVSKKTLCDKCKKAQLSHSCQDITALGRCAVEHEQKPTDNVEPKFHKGEWITNGQLTCKVLGVVGKSYELHLYNDDYCHFETDVQSVDKYYHLWSRKDAKCGDVLISSLYKQPFVYNGNYTCDSLGAYFGLNYQGKLSIGDNNDNDYNNWTSLTGVQPATKEQCDMLFKKLHDLNYKWDSEKKELWHKYL